MKQLLPALAVICLASTSQAATWEYSWPSSADDKTPQVEVTPLQYGKKWAYSVELDDEPASTATVVLPLLSKYAYTDAPPGISGGKERPFVGTAAIYLLRFDASNNTFLDKAQATTLRDNGWSLVSHSYWHTGNHWDKSKALSPADFRRELYWSQVLWPQVVSTERSSTHFVYPNGDYNFGPYLKEFNMRSASRVGGKLKRSPSDPAEWLDLDRNWLDEGVWSKSGDPLQGLPKNGPQAGDVVVDFTHGVNADPNSDNHKRWSARLDHIATNWGKAGDDSVWVAPTDDIVAYNLASKAAKVSIERGKIRVVTPDDLPGSPLTLHLTGLDPQAKLVAPSGGTLYRKGDEAWLTSPRIGQAGVAAPKPNLELVYKGEVKNVTLENARRIAGVRLRQGGTPKSGFALSIEAVGANGVTSIVPADKANIGSGWGVWSLFPTIPDTEAPLATEVRTNTDPSLKEMEIWVVAE